MAEYTVRSGQNIYDVALMLHGSVEGIFDLLVSNEWLNMETELKHGMTLNYNENFIINKSLVLWFQTNNILVKNGEHIFNHLDLESFIKSHIEKCHPELYKSISAMSPDEQNMYWEGFYVPRMTINQQGQTSAIRFKLKDGKHLLIDWGDCSDLQIADTSEEIEIEHCYKGAGKHIITLYGDCEFALLDLVEINGIYYPLCTLYADSFLSALDVEDLNKLVITR